MSKVAPVVLWLSLFLVGACAVSQEELHPEVSGFIRLLVSSNDPTLAEFEKFSGECGGEPELGFALNACRSKGWEIDSKSCVDFTRRRCRESEREPSLYLSWLRDRFSTVGKDYRLLGVQSEAEGVELIEVEIGANRFLLFHDTTPYPQGAWWSTYRR